jgi:hypothetical protein
LKIKSEFLKERSLIQEQKEASAGAPVSPLQAAALSTFRWFPTAKPWSGLTRTTFLLL